MKRETSSGAKTTGNRKVTAMVALNQSPDDWFRNKESQFENKVVRYLVERYRLFEEAHRLMDPDDVMRHPDERTHYLTLNQFYTVFPDYPVRFHVGVLSPEEVKSLTPNKLLTNPLNTALGRIYKKKTQCYVGDRDRCGVIFRIPHVPVALSPVIHNCGQCNACVEGIHTMITFPGPGWLEMEPLSVLLGTVDYKIEPKSWRGI